MRDQLSSLQHWLQETGQFFIAIGLTLGVLGWLLFAPHGSEPPPPPKRITLQDSVRVAGPWRIAITAGTPLEKHLESVIAARKPVESAFFTVAGRVVASSRPETNDERAKSDKLSATWQFDAPEVQTAYADWQKARADIAFARTQLASVRELVEARVTSQQKVVERLKKLVAVGTDSLKDLAAEENNLRQAIIQGRKDEHEASAAVAIAERNEASLNRQLQLAGLDPRLLGDSRSDTDIVMAEVPEGRLSQVKIGQGVSATFLGVPEQRFDGKICSLVPVLTRDRHSMRVLFIIHDPMDRIRPGMFADIGLGTDQRQTISIPAEALLHIQRSDFVLVHETEDLWRVVEVQVGEPHGDQIEISKGLADGDRVLTRGAILTKPVVQLSLRAGANGSANGNGSASGNGNGKGKGKGKEAAR